MIVALTKVPGDEIEVRFDEMCRHFARPEVVQEIYDKFDPKQAVIWLHHPKGEFCVLEGTHTIAAAVRHGYRAGKFKLATDDEINEMRKKTNGWIPERFWTLVGLLR